MKVYVVESGDYEMRGIDAIFATREAAETYIQKRLRDNFKTFGLKEREVPSGTFESITIPARDNKATLPDGRVVALGPTTKAVVVPRMVMTTAPAETFEEYSSRNANAFEITEYDVEDATPT